jgi:hypothetical protein
VPSADSQTPPPPPQQQHGGQPGTPSAGSDGSVLGRKLTFDQFKAAAAGGNVNSPAAPPPPPEQQQQQGHVPGKALTMAELEHQMSGGPVPPPPPVTQPPPPPGVCVRKPFVQKCRGHSCEKGVLRVAGVDRRCCPCLLRQHLAIVIAVGSGTAVLQVPCCQQQVKLAKPLACTMCNAVSICFLHAAH